MCDILGKYKDNEATQIEKDTFVFGQDDFFNFESIRKSKKFCDVVIQVDGRRIYAHRVILAGTIPYFSAMFAHNMVESQQEEITMKEMDPDILELFIGFAYSGKICMNPKNVQSVLECSIFLQLTKVTDACCNFMKKRLHVDNVLELRRYADVLGCSKLVEASKYFLQGNFSEFSETCDFLSLPFLEVKDLISLDELCSNEKQVFKSVMAWIKHDPARAIHLPELLNHVRLPLLTPQYLVDHVSTEELIKGSPECMDLLNEAKRYHLRPNESLTESLKIQSRSYGCVCVIGNRNVAPNFVEIYNPTTGHWRIVQRLPVKIDVINVEVIDNKLFVIGRRSFIMYDSTTHTWSIAAIWAPPKVLVSTAVLFNKLYACGGSTMGTLGVTDAVECYDPETNKWTCVSSMLKERREAGVIALGNYIYAIGGDGFETTLNCMERFDPETNKWESMPPMLSRRSMHGVATMNGCIYVCGGWQLSSAEVYDPITGKWKYIASMNKPRCYVSLVANCGKLYAIGGSDVDNYLDSVEMYDPEKNTWEFVEPVCTSHGLVGACAIPPDFTFKDELNGNNEI